MHSTIRVRNWSVRVGFGNRSLTSQLEGAQRQAETHFLVENIESEFCMTRDFSKTAKCSFPPPLLKTLPWLILLVPFLHCFYESVFIFASFLHSVGSSQVSRTWFALMSFQSQRPISTVSLPSSGFIRILRLKWSKYAKKKKKRSFFVFHKSSIVVPFYFCLLKEVFYSVPLLSEGCDAALSHTEVAGCGVMTVCHCNLPVTHQWLGGKLKMLSEWIRSSMKAAFIILRMSLFFPQLKLLLRSNDNVQLPHNYALCVCSILNIKMHVKIHFNIFQQYSNALQSCKVLSHFILFYFMLSYSQAQCFFNRFYNTCLYWVLVGLCFHSSI